MTLHAHHPVPTAPAPAPRRAPPAPAASVSPAVALPRTPAEVLALQRTIGNRAVGRLLRAAAGVAPVRHAPTTPALQRVTHGFRDLLGMPEAMVEDDDDVWKEGETVTSGYEVRMPDKTLGQVGEELVSALVTKNFGQHPRVEQNRSGHGLDLFFTVEGQANVKKFMDRAGLFGLRNALPAHDVPSSPSYVVILEVKANTAALSTAQSDPYTNVYKQSKKPFAKEIKEAIEDGYMEVYYKVTVEIDESTSSANPAWASFRQMDSRGFGSRSRRGTLGARDDVLLPTPDGLSWLSSKELGTAGEVFARENLRAYGYTDVLPLQDDSGHGIDIVARRGANFHMFEVKTHTGKTADDKEKAPSLTIREKGREDFAYDVLLQILNRSGSYAGAGKEVRDVAAEILRRANTKARTVLGAKSADYEEWETNLAQNATIDMVANKDVGWTNPELRFYVDDFVRFSVINVTFPDLGEEGSVSASMMEWKRKPWETR